MILMMKSNERPAWEIYQAEPGDLVIGDTVEHVGQAGHPQEPTDFQLDVIHFRYWIGGEACSSQDYSGLRSTLNA